MSPTLTAALNGRPRAFVSGVWKTCMIVLRGRASSRERAQGISPAECARPPDRRGGARRRRDGRPAQALDHRFGRERVAGVHDRERPLGTDVLAERRQFRQANRRIDRVGGARPAAAEFDDREPDCAHVDVRDNKPAPARPRPRRPPGSSAGAPARKSAGPPSAATMRSNVSAALPGFERAAHQRLALDHRVGRAPPGAKARRRATASRAGAVRPGVFRSGNRRRSAPRPRCRRRWRAARSCR